MVNDVFMVIARMPKAIDITGERFGRLVAVRRTGKDKRNNALWLCRWIPMSEQYKNKQSNSGKMPLPEPYKGEP